MAMRLGETPVPIPNTMVKTQAADGTMPGTAWESRWLPDSKKKIRPYDFINWLYFGGLAQLGEHLPCKQGVESSNLLVSIDSNEQYHCYYIFAFFDNLRKGLIAQPVRAHA